jgi:hypothetical protein
MGCGASKAADASAPTTGAATVSGRPSSGVAPGAVGRWRALALPHLGLHHLLNVLKNCPLLREHGSAVLELAGHAPPGSACTLSCCTCCTHRADEWPRATPCVAPCIPTARGAGGPGVLHGGWLGRHAHDRRTAPPAPTAPPPRSQPSSPSPPPWPRPAAAWGSGGARPPRPPRRPRRPRPPRPPPCLGACPSQRRRAPRQTSW